jgi:hypothetical protein
VISDEKANRGAAHDGCADGGGTRVTPRNKLVQAVNAQPWRHCFQGDIFGYLSLSQSTTAARSSREQILELVVRQFSAIDSAEVKTAQQRPAKPIVADSRTKWLTRARKMPAAQRVPIIERRLRTLSKTPTAANVFFRKELLRLRDESRLEAGMVSSSELHRENSPFAGMDFRTARINFRRRIRA